jgi:hypothetical protein
MKCIMICSKPYVDPQIGDYYCQYVFVFNRVLKWCSQLQQINFLNIRKSEEFETDFDVLSIYQRSNNLKFHTVYIIFKYDTTYHITLNIYYVYYII